ncbi:MAG: hypothetical protein WAW96_14595 [Alphaproteobacteria bacterium]
MRGEEIVGEAERHVAATQRAVSGRFGAQRTPCAGLLNSAERSALAARRNSTARMAAGLHLVAVVARFTSGTARLALFSASEMP